ncbi:hypothetical protein CF319_g8712 [Tilletia indica]|nr:hypothetical protein CF319_g8712 [Tilletia indica]
MEVCTTLGMLTPQHAVQLKNAGLTAYNHNVDTSCEYYDKGEILRLGEKPIKNRSAFQVRPWRRPPTSGLPGVTDIIPTGAPPVTLPGGVLPTNGLPGVTDILPGTGLPGVTDIVPTGLPGVTDILPTTGLPGLTSLLPTATLRGVTDAIPTGTLPTGSGFLSVDVGLSSIIGATMAIGDITKPLTVPVSAPITGSVTLSGSLTGTCAMTTLPIGFITTTVPALSTSLPAVTSAFDTRILGSGISGTSGLGVSASPPIAAVSVPLGSITNILPSSVLPSISIPAGILPTSVFLVLPISCPALVSLASPTLSPLVFPRSRSPAAFSPLVLRTSSPPLVSLASPTSSPLVLPRSRSPAAFSSPLVSPVSPTSFPALVPLASSTLSPLVFPRLRCLASFFPLQIFPTVTFSSKPTISTKHRHISLRYPGLVPPLVS